MVYEPTDLHTQTTKHLALLTESQRKLRSENKWTKVLTTQDLDFLEQYRACFGGGKTKMVCYANQHPLNHQQVPCDVC